MTEDDVAIGGNCLFEAITNFLVMQQNIPGEETNRFVFRLRRRIVHALIGEFQNQCTDLPNALQANLQKQKTQVQNVIPEISALGVTIWHTPDKNSPKKVISSHLFAQMQADDSSIDNAMRCLKEQNITKVQRYEGYVGISNVQLREILLRLGVLH
jgi:G3E family GTPase